MDSLNVYYYNPDSSIMYFSGSSEISTGNSSHQTALEGFGLLGEKYVLSGNPNYPNLELKIILRPINPTITKQSIVKQHVLNLAQKH